MKKRLLEIKTKFNLKKILSVNEIYHIIAWCRTLCNTYYGDTEALKIYLLHALDHCFHISHKNCPKEKCQYFEEENKNIINKKIIYPNAQEAMQSYLQKFALNFGWFSLRVHRDSVSE